MTLEKMKNNKIYAERIASTLPIDSIVSFYCEDFLNEDFKPCFDIHRAVKILSKYGISTRQPEFKNAINILKCRTKVFIIENEKY